MTAPRHPPRFVLDPGGSGSSSDEDNDGSILPKSAISLEPPPPLASSHGFYDYPPPLSRRSSAGSPVIPTALFVASSSGPDDDDALLAVLHSLQSFSYTYSLNSISSRITVLKHSLEFLRDHPKLLEQFESSLVSSASFGPTPLFRAPDRNGVFQQVLSNVRHSASSVTLSMLKSINAYTPPSSVSSSSFDENLRSVISILERATSSSTSPSANPSLAHFSSRSTSLILNGQRLQQPQSQSSHRPISPAGRSFSEHHSARPTVSDAINTQASQELELQILEALATPYFELSPASISTLHRTGSLVTLANRSMSSVNLTGWSGATNGSNNGGPSNTGPSGPRMSVFSPLSSLASKYATRTAVFTTQIAPPFDVLSTNDLACLVFGFSQGEMRGKSILDILDTDHREAVAKALTETPDAVKLCGSVFSVDKLDGRKSCASFWVRENSKGFLVWVIEEVACQKLVLTESPSRLAALIPTLNLSEPLTNGQYHCLQYDGTMVPTRVWPRTSDKSAPGTITLEVRSLPNMAGMIVLRAEDLSVLDYSQAVIENVLGYTYSLKNKRIDSIIPRFSKYLTIITDMGFSAVSSPGLVIPEHMFRKVSILHDSMIAGNDPATVAAQAPRFAASKGIQALNVYGQEVIVDVQLRVLSPRHLGLWLTYTKEISGSTYRQDELPSQLKLFEKRVKSRAPSTGPDSGSSSGGHSTNLSLSKSEMLDDDDTGPVTVTAPVTTKLSQEELNSISEKLRHVASAGTTVLPGIPEPYSAHIKEIGARRRNKTLAEFTVLENMGEGAFGKVLLAQYNAEPRLKVVVKCVIKERILVDTWTRDRKLGTIPNEIKVMATLSLFPHQNIIRLLDFFESDEFYHIEMERHGDPGTDLFDLIEVRPEMSDQDCKSIFRQVVSAVQHLHTQGIVHRDIKDENIVVDKSGLIKLIDFGSSAFVRQGPFDVFVGTLDYAAPEVLGGQLYSGKPQDIWALGILLYTIAYKENPFYNVDEVMDGDLRIPHEPSQGCVELIRSMLNRDVRRRPSIDDIASHPWLQLD